MRDLAHQVVRDGEGASKFVEIAVTGAASDAAARTVGLADRQLAAGQDGDRRRGLRTGAASSWPSARPGPADRDRLAIRFGDIEVARDGWRAPDYARGRRRRPT